MCCLTNLRCFDIPLLHYFTNLNSSIICCLSSGDMYLFFGTFTSAFISILASSFFTAETLVILSAI